MNLSAALTVIENRLGSRTGLGTRITAEMDLAQPVLERGSVLPWFLLQQASLSTVAETVTLAVPTGFLREYDEALAYIQDTDGEWKPLVKKLYDELKTDESLTAASGRPKYYALVGGSLYLFPTPDAVYPIKMFCYIADALPGTLSSGQTNLWLTNAPDVLINRTGREIAKYLRDRDALSLFTEELREAMNQLVVENIARSQAAYEAFMGE